MSDIIRFYTLRRNEKPLAPESFVSPMDNVSEAQRDFMRPPVPGSELWDGLIRPGDDRDAAPMPLKPFTGKHVEDPDYPTDDPTVPPRHRRT